ncbi:MAG TPA: hypothetical protein VKA46_29655 [Gemmataceae bacterium]|nr:hypothetical protein [Gemmataceae bacterium]
MTDPTLPAAVVCRVLAAISESRVRQLENLLYKNPRSRPKGSVAHGRREQLASLKRQTGRLYSLVDRCPRGVTLDALAFGCLCAVAHGFMDPLADLEDRLEWIGHPALARVLDTPGEDVAALAEAILTARPAGGR